MTSLGPLLTGLALCSAIAVIAARRPSLRNAREQWLDGERMPRELRDATLVGSEISLRIRVPVALHGDADQVYRTADGRVIVVDTKARMFAKVYPRDIVQVSVYAFMLKRGALPAAASALHEAYGYMRLKTPVGVSYERVRLLRDQDVLVLYQRYQALRARRGVAPKFSPSEKRCSYCERRRVCPRSLAVA